MITWTIQNLRADTAILEVHVNQRVGEIDRVITFLKQQIEEATMKLHDLGMTVEQVAPIVEQLKHTSKLDSLEFERVDWLIRLEICRQRERDAQAQAPMMTEAQEQAAWDAHQMGY